MVLPWELIGTALAAIAAAWGLLRLREAPDDRDAAFDLAFTVGLWALVAARLVRVALDVASAGTAALDLRAMLTLGSGLSTPGAVLGGLAGGWWHARRHELTGTQWRATATAAAAGLAVWSGLAFARDEMIGAAGVPVAAAEAVAFLALGWWSARTDRWTGARLGAAFAAAVVAIHLAASLARPNLSTLDADVEIALGVVAVVLAVMAVRGVPARLVGLAVGVGLSVVAGLTVLAVAGEDAGSVAAPAPSDGAADGVQQDVEDVGDVAGSLEGALRAGGADGADGAPPVFGPEELAAFVAATGDRPVVVNFWASWCPPCRAEAPALARSARALGDEVAFLGVNVDDSPRAARAFVDRYALPFPSVRDDGRLRKELGMRGLPTTVVLHPDGSVAVRIVGGLDPGSLASAVDRARR